MFKGYNFYQRSFVAAISIFFFSAILILCPVIHFYKRMKKVIRYSSVANSLAFDTYCEYSISKGLFRNSLTQQFRLSLSDCIIWSFIFILPKSFSLPICTVHGIVSILYWKKNILVFSIALFTWEVLPSIYSHIGKEIL